MRQGFGVGLRGKKGATNGRKYLKVKIGRLKRAISYAFCVICKVGRSVIFRTSINHQGLNKLTHKIIKLEAKRKNEQ